MTSPADHGGRENKEKIMTTPKKDKIRDKVRERYGSIATDKVNDCGCSPSCCSPQTPSDIEQAEKLGYSSTDLSAVPAGANMSLGCGNPQAIASLKEGETVLDLGSGGGFDCFLAARQVGDKGRIIGVDMTPEMISKARENTQKGNFENVEFRLGEIEHLPVSDNSIDVVISNCVINLSPDKQQVYREIARVLKPGGRIAISDVVAVRELPRSVREDLDAYAGCVSGAALVRQIEQWLTEAGMSEVNIVLKHNSTEFIKDWFPGTGIENYVLSADILARKTITVK